MKYESQVSEVKNILSGARSVLIALSAQAEVDDLAAGLALYLSLKQAGKQVEIVTQSTILVSHTNLFGIGSVKDKVTATGTGDFVITLSGVANPQDPEKPIPAVENMDWQVVGSDLNLIFRVKPGFKFVPVTLNSSYQGGGFSLVFVIGAASLADLGPIYSDNQQIFAGAKIVNIDNSSSNSSFGSINIVDSATSSVAEIIGELISLLQLPYDADTASNILSGIFSTTANLQAGTVSADTFQIVSNALRAGGQKPSLVTPQATAVAQPAAAQPLPQATPAASFDLSKIVGAPVNMQNQPVSGGIEQKTEEYQPSPEELPMGETAGAPEPESDWLTPKIYKGSALG